MLSPVSFELLPSGSPNTFRYHPVTSNEADFQIKSPRHSSENRYFGGFPYRVVSDRSDTTPTSHAQSPQISKLKKENKLSFTPNLSSDSEEIELPNFEISPLKKPEEKIEISESQDQQLSYIAKTVAVQVLSKYYKRSKETKEIFDNIYATFFQGFDNWRRELLKEKRKKMELDEEKENFLIEKANEKYKIAEIKLKNMEKEVEKWNGIKVKEINKNVPKIKELNDSVTIKNAVDEGLSKIESIIFELDKLQKKIQDNNAKCITIKRNSEYIAEILKQKIQKPVNIRNLLK